MKYLDKPAIGNAGEYYFSYWISRYFNWPCRLLDIDVGIDAQIEIFDSEQHSIGNFLAVQIKTTVSENINPQIDLNNLQYWKSMNDVVILVSIKMNEEKPEIYWKIINSDHIDQYIEEAESNRSKKTTIEFTINDLLIPEDKSRFEILPYRGQVENVNRLNDKVNTKCQKIYEIMCDEESNQIIMDGAINDSIVIESIIMDFNDICHEIDQIEELLLKHPKLDMYIKNLYSHENFYPNAEKCIEKLVDVLYKQGDGEFIEDYRLSWQTYVSHPKVLKMLKYI